MFISTPSTGPFTVCLRVGCEHSTTASNGSKTDAQKINKWYIFRAQEIITASLFVPTQNNTQKRLDFCIRNTRFVCCVYSFNDCIIKYVNKTELKRFCLFFFPQKEAKQFSVYFDRNGVLIKP